MAAAFGVYYVWTSTSGVWRGIWAAGFGLMLVASLLYSIFAFPTRADNFQAKPDFGIPTLDGWKWVENTFPDDYAAIEWARANLPREAVILEATGDQYSFDNRVSVATGLPTVLGWGGHELQWRGNYDEAGPRQSDVERIYSSVDLSETRELLDKYGVDFVVVGDIERKKYKLNPVLIDKFGKLGEQVFEQGSMRIYRVGQISVSLGAQ
jgi:uncharacterized membrane protein